MCSTCNSSILLASEDVKKHRIETNLWIVIHNDVYDVTNFINNHPGGRDPLLCMGGRDGTQAFEDVGHSLNARIMLKKYKIGILRPEDRVLYVAPCCSPIPSPKVPSNDSSCVCKFVERQDSKAGRLCRTLGSRVPSREKVQEPVIIVPLEEPPPPPRRQRSEPLPSEKSSWWLWLLLLAGVAAAGAFAYKKYGGS